MNNLPQAKNILTMKRKEEERIKNKSKSYRASIPRTKTGPDKK